MIGNTQIAEAKAADAVQSAGLTAPLPRARPLLPEAPPSPMINVAMVTPAAATSAVPAASTATTTDAPATFAERVAMVSEATASASATAYASQPQQPLFQTLYQPDQRGPVAPVVRELWGARHAAPIETAAAVPPVGNTSAPGSGASINAPLDLFRFLRPSARPA